MKKIPRYIFVISFLLIFSIGVTGQPSAAVKDLLVFENSHGKTKSIRSARQWQKQRQKIIDGMQQVMGPLPDASKKVPLDLQIIEEVTIGKVRRLKITFAPEANDRVPAYLLIPAICRERFPVFSAFTRQPE